MYHTEGYVDKQTYFTEGNIRSLCMEQNGRNCYFWLVQAIDMEEANRTNVRVLYNWFYQELPLLLDRGNVYIQKELNRFGDFWKKETKGERERTFMYLYYHGQMYFYGGDAGVCQWSVMDGIGMCISGGLVENDYQFTENGRKLERDRCMAWLGNELQRELLKLLSEQKLEQGYFMIWEDAYVI